MGRRNDGAVVGLPGTVIVETRPAGGQITTLAALLVGAAESDIRTCVPASPREVPCRE
jgi:hypothetical protein